jgi:hypothetical protein
MYSTQNHWVMDFVRRPVFWKLENTFWKLDLFLSSDKAREALTLLGSLERANQT